MLTKVDTIFMNFAKEFAGLSHCVKIKVGAVIVSKAGRVISHGKNGPPSKTVNCDQFYGDSGCPRSLEGSCSLALHAEQNAILYIKNLDDLKDSTIYSTLSPCLNCSKVIYSVGIKKVIFLDSYAEYKKLKIDEGLEFLKTFGIEVTKYNI